MMLPTVIPARIRRGATIGVVAPASPPSSPDKTDRGIRYLEGRGYRILRGETLSRVDGYLAGGDAIRANDLNAMFANPDVDAIFSLRGGYGCTRILPLVDYELVRRCPKVFVGYSDITALSMAFSRHAGLVTFAGPMVAADIQQGMDLETERDFWSTLSRPRARRILRFTEPGYPQTECSGSCSGVLLGGNLAILASLLGTPFEPRWKGGILFLEDVGEQVYRIDRMLSQLRNAGALSALAGVVLGRFTEIPASERVRDLGDVFAEYFTPLRIPVLSGAPFGHSLPKVTLPLGARVTMHTRRRTLVVEQPVVL